MNEFTKYSFSTRAEIQNFDFGIIVVLYFARRLDYHVQYQTTLRLLVISHSSGVVEYFRNDDSTLYTLHCTRTVTKYWSTSLLLLSISPSHHE